MLTLLRARPVWFTLLLLLLALGYETWLGGQAAAKLRATALDGIDHPADIELVLRFTPEPFHMAVLQDAGRLVKLDGRHVFLRGVPAAGIRALARRYWIDAVLPWSGDGAP